MKKTKYISIGILLLIAIFIEIIVGNYAFFISAGNEKEEICLSEIEKSEDAVELADVGVYFSGEKTAYIEFLVDGNRLKNIAIQASCINGTESWSNSNGNRIYATLESTMVSVDIVGYDEAGNETLLVENRRIGIQPESVDIVSLSNASNITRMRIYFQGVKGTEVVLSKLALNYKVPFHFNILRFILVTVAIYSVYAFRRNSILWKKKLLNENGNLDKKMRYAIGIGIGILAFWILFLILQNPVYVGGNGGFEPYIELSHALANGHTYIAQEVPDQIKNLENPYDVYQRAYCGANYLLDYAYYNGHYYVYFGIVPCLIFYLPCYLLFGEDPGNWIVIWLCIVVMMVSIACFIKAFIKRYYKEMPVGVGILFFFCLLLLGAPPSVLSDACAYYIPMLTAIDLVFIGLTFWLNALEEQNARVNYIKIAAGSLCIAMVAGCRPQLAFAAVLAIPILWLPFVNMKANRQSLIRSLCSFILPVLPVAVFIMYYNAIRFGSMFDFGVKYNLTSFNVYDRTLSLEQLKYGFDYYLFHLPLYSSQFPFLQQGYPNLEGTEDIKIEISTGGLLTGNWILLMGMAMISYSSRKHNKKRELRLMQWLCIGLACLTVVIAISIGGLYERYQLDFAFLIGIATMMVWMEIWQKWKIQKKKKWIGEVLLVFMVLMFGFELPRYMLNGVWGLYDANPEVYALIEKAVMFWK